MPRHKYRVTNIVIAYRSAVQYRVNISKSEAVHSFNTIDTDKNGKISQEIEFLAAADDFYNGVDETEVSRVLLGRLED